MQITSDFFSITYGPGALTISTQPGGAVAGQSLTTQPSVSFVDRGGFLMMTENGVAVTAELVTAGTLMGTTQV
jgi:hypothetical protein